MLLFMKLMCCFYFFEQSTTVSADSYRLKDGGSWLEGRLEVEHSSEWGTVCEDLFDLNAAHVACNYITLGKASSFNTCGGGSGRIWLSQLQCNGNETSLEECTHNGWGNEPHGCHHSQDICIVCVVPTSVSMIILGQTYYNTLTKANYTDAVELCERSYNARLPVFKTRSESSRRTFIPVERFWLALNDGENEGVFVWSTSNGNYPLKYDMWKTNEPNNVVNEDCVTFDETTWNDIPCKQRISVICQGDALIPYLGNFHYVLVGDMTFNEAFSACDSLGLSLPVITTQRKHNSYRLLNISFWLALNDKDAEDKFVWSMSERDKSQVGWNLLSHSDNAVDRDCTVYVDGQWNIVNCNDTYSVLCEKDLCSNAIGMEDGSIPNSNILTSTNQEAARYSRLNQQTSEGVWNVSTPRESEWIQVDLGVVDIITGLMVQGCGHHNMWVTSYHVNHSSDGVYFEYAMNEGNGTLINLFKGNNDSDSIVTNLFYNSVKSRFIRIVAVNWEAGVCIRFEPIGCKTKKYCVYYAPCQNGGICSDDKYTYNCECLDGYFGKNCEHVKQNYLAITAVGGKMYYTASKIANNSAAMQLCDTLYDAHLPVFKTKDESERMKDIPHDLYKWTWLALNDRVTNRDYYWTTYTDNYQLTYNDTWNVGEPNGETDEECCFAFPIATFGDVPCDWNLSIVCEKVGSLPFSDKLFYILPDIVPLSNASALCKDLDADLPIIKTQKENEAFRSIGLSFWLALNDKDTEEEFVWSTRIDEDQQLLGWNLLPVSGNGIDRDCTAYVDGHWEIVNCDEQYTVFCEKAVCRSSLGMEDRTIPDENILASSNPEQAFHSRLQRFNAGWRGVNSTSSQEWIQADLGGEKLVAGTILQGCDTMEWVTSYHVNYSSDGVHFEYAMNERNAKLSILFDGNVDRNTPVTNLFYYSVTARFIRIIAVAWETQVCIRFELIGCREMDYCSYYSPCENGAECVNMENTYNCTCLDDYSGRHCEIVESTTTSLTTGQSTTTSLTTGQSMTTYLTTDHISTTNEGIISSEQAVESTTTSLTTGQSTTTSLTTGQSMTTYLTTDHISTTNEGIISSEQADELEDRSTLSWSTSAYTIVYIPNEVVRMFYGKETQLQSLHSLDQMLVQVKHNATFENIFNFVKNVLTVTSTLLPSIEREDDKFKIVSMIEVLYKIAASLLSEDDIIEIDSEYQFVNIRKISSSSSSFDIDLDVDRVNGGSGCSISMSISLPLIPDDFLILVIFYQNRPLFYGTTDLESVSKERFIGSGVVTITLFNSLLNKIPLHVNITMRHLKNVTERILADDLITQCVFWNVTYKEWFDNDCITFHESHNSTTCICDHTTSYAILVGSDVTNVNSGAQEALSMITTILCVSSVCCLCLTLFVYMFFEELRHSERNNIHKNLVFSLLLAQLFFLVGVDNVKEKILCTAIAIILHYLYLCVFTWMTIEGVNLYLKIVRVFNSDLLSMRAYMIIGWGLPVVIVGVSVAFCIDGYGMVTNDTDEPYICWIDITSSLLYAFIGPILVTLLINSFVSVIVGRIIFKKSDSNDRWKDARSTLKGMVTLLPLLGLPWILCLFAKNSSIALATIFTVCNAPQGVFLFCTHCLFSKEVRTVMTSRWMRRKAQSSIGPQTLSKTSTTVTTNALPRVESN